MSWAVTAVVAAVAVSAGVSYYNGQQQAKQNERAMRQAKANADKQANLAEQDMNRANQKQPDTNALLSAAQQSGRAGASGTMLTGPAGIDPSSLSLGKSTLLGQ
jgi:uncharacterized protein HemX